MRKEPYFHRYSVNTDPAKGEIQVLSCGTCREKSGAYKGYRIGEAFVVNLVLEGRGWFDNGRHRYSLKTGDSFVFFQETMYKAVAEEGESWMYCSLSLKGERIGEILQSIGLSEGIPVIRLDDPRRARVLFHRIGQCMQGKRTEGYDLALGGFARLLLSEYARGTPVPHSGLESVTYGSARAILHAAQWMIRHYSEPVVVSELADKCGYGTERFSRLFKRHIGMSPKEYLIRLRMDIARNLMYSDLAVKQISRHIGYEDALYFSRLFKKTYEVSPEEFRKRIPLREGAVTWRTELSDSLSRDGNKKRERPAIRTFPLSLMPRS